VVADVPRQPRVGSCGWNTLALGVQFMANGGGPTQRQMAPLGRKECIDGFRLIFERLPEGRAPRMEKRKRLHRIGTGG
jgi:hypothetical protein